MVNLETTWRAFQRAVLDLWQIDEFRLLFWSLLGIAVFVLVSYLIMRRSRDRCIKDFESYHALVLLMESEDPPVQEAYFGVLEVPVRAGNGFEVHYDPEGIENLPQLLAYMRFARELTGNEKFSDVAGLIYDRISSPDLKSAIESGLDPFAPPPEASHKVYQQDLEKLRSIVRVVDELPEQEKQARLKALEQFFHPSAVRRASRALGNFLSFAWDRVKDLASLLTGYLTKGRSQEIRAVAKDIEAKAFTYSPRSYEALLENSLGYLVKVKTISPDGAEWLTKGVLKEYSANYLCLYNTAFIMRATAEYRDCAFAGFEGESLVSPHGKPAVSQPDLVLEFESEVLVVRNTSNCHIRLAGVIADGKEASFPRETLRPGAQTSIKSATADVVKITYLKSIRADMILPRKYAVVVGRSEPRLKGIHDLTRFVDRLRDIPSPLSKIQSTARPGKNYC